VSAERWKSPRHRKILLAGGSWRGLRRHPRRQYIAACILATPDWVSRHQLRAINEIAIARTVQTGIQHVCDHIVPITHPDVCGLNVPWNLQVITRAQNAAKSNTWNPWQLDLPL
jgi:hypothetical protein